MVQNLLTMSNAEYHADTTRLSKSALDALSRSPAHYWHQYLNPKREPREQTAAFALGTLVHSAILEPNTFESEYIVCAEKFDGRTTAGKAAAAAFRELAGARTVISADDYATAMRMADAVFNHRAAAGLLAPAGRAEAVVHFTHPHTNRPCKIRPDFMQGPGGLVVDIKTTEDASPEAFARSVANYRYHVQEAFYLDGLTYAGGRPAGFRFIAVEKKAPFNVAVYALSDDAVDYGRGLYYSDLDAHARGVETGVWGGYFPGTQILELPRWAMRNA